MLLQRIGMGLLRLTERAAEVAVYQQTDQCCYNQSTIQPRPFWPSEASRQPGVVRCASQVSTQEIATNRKGTLLNLQDHALLQYFSVLEFSRYAHDVRAGFAIAMRRIGIAVNRVLSSRTSV